MKYLNINEQLDEWIIEYGIDRYHPRFAKRKIARGLIREFLNQYRNQEVIFVAASLTDSNYIWEECYGILSIKDTVLYDQIETYPWKDKAGRAVIIVSFYGRREAMARLHRHNIKAGSVYDYIFQRGEIILEGNYYDVFGEEYHTYQKKPTYDCKFYDVNAIFFHDRRNYEIAQDKAIKELYLSRVIFDCVYVKEWELTEKYINEYVKLGGTAAAKYEAFLQKVKELISAIKEELAVRQKDDIVIFWLDALEYGEDKDMLYLRSLSEKAVDFVNAYTVTPYTHSAAKSLFAHKYVVDDRAYKIKIDKDASFIQEIEERGFNFQFYTMLYQVDDSVRGRYYQNMFTPFTEVCWNAINDILISEKKMCAVIHEVFATHTPYVSFGLAGNEHFYAKDSLNILSDEEKRIRDRQALESRVYIDNVLKFYSDLLPDNTYKIYMSDHGHTELERFHTIFRIVHKKILPQQIKGVFSYINFDKLIYTMLENNNDFSEIVSEYALIQDVDYYFKVTLQLYLQGKGYSVNSLWGYKGIVTDQHRYIRYNDGREVCYNKEYDKQPITKEKIEQLRRLCTTYPSDIIQDEQFRYARNLYKTQQNYMKRNGEYEAEKKRVIAALFDELTDSSKIAIRGGGRHTWFLWFTLEQKTQRKISYVIDSDPKCMAAKLGVEIIGMDDLESKEIDTVIISSYKSELTWYNELQKVTNGVRIIGLYDYLEKNGIHCNMEFYKPEYIEEDIVWEE